MSSTEIIIVNWSSRAQTLECVSAVEQQLSDVDGASITVVDNGSTDGSAHAIAVRHPRVKLFPLRENRGFTGGLTAALAGSQARNVVFLNNDAVPEAGWLASLHDAIEHAPSDVVSIGGKIVSPDGQLIDFIGGVVTFDGHAFQDGFRMKAGSRPDPNPGDELLFACGGNMISRRELLMELGAFDDDYFAYLEDVDFGWRTWISGYRATIEPRAVVRHASSSTSNRLGDFERGVLFERNALQTALKNYEDLGASAGAILFAYLHRLHHYATTRNLNVAELMRAPFGGALAAQSKKRSVFARAWRKLVGPAPIAAIDDPMTAMQFRALEWIMRNQSRIAQKRDDVQKRRRRSDAQIFAKFPLHFVPTYPGDDELMRSPLFRALRANLASVDRTLTDIMQPSSRA
ncbi:MAG TPA: glycosyltransferase family 2 protein [Thermoanaerobaculia bacterium]|nr:glycosyltransferase family 2 protein [Thermoanaerobaculia bacterium]